jgi:hypothetical protein
MATSRGPPRAVASVRRLRGWLPYPCDQHTDDRAAQPGARDPTDPEPRRRGHPIMEKAHDFIEPRRSGPGHERSYSPLSRAYSDKAGRLRI